MTEEELEREAVEYAEKINLQNVNISGVVRNHISQAYLVGAEPREKRIAELEKENAELKEKLKPENCLKLLAKDGYIKFTSNQLTKAKDHIKKLLDCLKQDTNDPQTNYYVCQYMDKAEQFLKEIEK